MLHGLAKPVTELLLVLRREVGGQLLDQSGLGFGMRPQPPSHCLRVALDGAAREVRVAGDATVQQAERLLQLVVDDAEGGHLPAAVGQPPLRGRVEHAVGGAQMSRAPSHGSVGAVLRIFQRRLGPLMRVCGGAWELDAVRHVSGVQCSSRPAPTLSNGVSPSVRRP